MLTYLRILFCSLIFLTTNSCSQQSIEGYRDETQSIIRILTETLKSVHNREDLIQAESRLKKYFNNLTDVMIEAQEYNRKNPQINVEQPSSTAVNDEFLIELNRVCHIEGGREIIEKCQQESLERLDANLKKGLRAKG